MSISEISYDGRHAGIQNCYPYTDFHEMNLDWLLVNYKSIIDKVNETISWMNNHQIEYEEAIQRLTAVENEIDTFESEMERRFNNLQDTLTTEVNQLIEDTRLELDETKRQIQQEVAAAIAQMQIEFENLYNSVKNDIAAMNVEIQRAIFTLKNSISANNQYVFDYVEERLNRFIQDLPDYENLIIYNPIRGAQTNVQTAIIDLYSMFAVYGLTASQYDSLQLTASAYDAKGLTAREYDVWGYKLLDYPDPQTHMRDPFTGYVVLNKVVIYELAELHREALSAAEYDDLELPAEEYDNLELTAYIYDWYGIVVFGDALTAIQYDNKQMLAAYYDSLRLSAYQYDVYGKLLIA